MSEYKRLTKWVNEQKTLAEPIGNGTRAFYDCMKGLADLEDAIESGELRFVENQPLTVEQVKATEKYDWLWVVKPNIFDGTGYRHIAGQTEKALLFFDCGYKYELAYSTYGIEWIAYKYQIDEAQAEAKLKELLEGKN